MKIYIAITERGMYVTASERLAKSTNFEGTLKAMQEWEVKTQGVNFCTWAKGKYIIDNRKK